MAATIILIILIAIAAFFAGKRMMAVFFGKKDCCNTSSNPKAKRFKDVKVADTNEANYSDTLELTVGGMTCEHCVKAVENAVNSIPGLWATVDLESRKAVIRGKGAIDAAAVERVIDQAGYYIIRQPKEA